MHKQSVREIHFAASALCTLHFPSMAIVAHFTLHLHQTKRLKWDFAQRHFGVKHKEKNGDKTKYVGSFYFNQTVTFPEHYMTTLFFAITLFTSTECCYHFLRCFGIFRVLMISVCGKLYRSLLIEFFFVSHRKKNIYFFVFLPLLKQYSHNRIQTSGDSTLFSTVLLLHRLSSGMDLAS